MEFDLKHLEYFVAAAEYPSFRQAAARLDVRQSVLSRRIRALEDELGVSLFQRDKSGVRLTLAGQRFLARAKSNLADLEDMVKAARNAGRGLTGHLRIGAMSTLGPGILHDLVRGYADQHSDVEIHFVQGGSKGLIAQVRDRSLDLAIIMGNWNEPNCDQLCLGHERVFVAVPENHRLALCGAIEWPALREERLIVPRAAPGPEVHQSLIKHLSGNGELPPVVTHDVDPAALINLVGLGFGITLTCESAVGITYPGVVFRPLVGPDDLIPVGAVWSPENDNPALRRFVSLAKSMARRAAKPAPQLA